MKRKFLSINLNLIPAVFMLSLLAAWETGYAQGWLPRLILPAPSLIFMALVKDASLLSYHARVTLVEAFLGLGLGVVLAFILSLVMERFHLLRKAIYPLLVISQTVPVIAVAPLLVLLLGYGMAPKVTLVILVCFFPIVIALLDGFTQTDVDAINLLQSMGASRWQVMQHLKLPNAMPGFFSGLKISVAYAFVGAVIAEWLGGSAGLGVYMTRVKKAYAFDKMFAVILLIVLISLFLMYLTNTLEKKVLAYRYIREKN